MTCPKCGSPLTEADEGRFPFCEDCGHVEYDAATLALRDEVEAEYYRAKQACWPDPVPSYLEWMEGKL